MKRIFLGTVIVLLSVITLEKANAQVYCYKYLHSVTSDGVKIKHKLFVGGDRFYFVFNNSKSECYICDKDGMIGSYDTPYTYIGCQNGMFIYKQNCYYWGESYLYFSTDYQKLNWGTGIDYYNKASPWLPKGAVRVLRYTEGSEEDEIEAPSSLY